MPGHITKAMLFSADGRIEELVDLLAILSCPTPRRSPGASQKLRPIQLLDQTSTTGEDRILFPMEPGENLVMPDTDPADTPESLIQIKLRDTFFYQHRDIKEICNFTVSWVFKTFEGELVQECFKPLIDDKKTDNMTVEIDLVGVCKGDAALQVAKIP
jgi:hypothetical protein